MSAAIATTPLLRAVPSHGVGSWIKNFVFGRVFANWKDRALKIGVVFWVAKAALTFFTGSWLLAIAEFFTAGILAMMRREYIDFTNLHKATGEYRQQNNEYRLSNLEHRRLNAEQRRQNAYHQKLNEEYRQENVKLRQNVEAFRQQVALLARERERFARENATFGRNNRVYKGQIDAMKRTLRQAAGEIGAISGRGRRIMEAAVRSFEEKERALTAIARDIDTKNRESVRQWNELAGQVSRLRHDGVRALNEAKAQLAEVLAEIREHEATKAALRAEIGRLEQVRVQLEKTAIKVDLAADRNLAAAGKRYVSSIMSGEAHGTIVLGLMLAGYAFSRATNTPIAGLS